jgi:hypothetical protein
MVLKSVGVLSAGKVMGALGVVIGLIAGGFVALVSMLGVVAQPAGNGNAQVPALFFGMGAVVFLPIFYGVISFVTGILYAAFYNLIA